MDCLHFVDFQVTLDWRKRSLPQLLAAFYQGSFQFIQNMQGFQDAQR
jgi:hypothetical protein